MNKFGLSGLAAALCLSITSVQAATVSYTSTTIADATTNWNNTVDIQMFDSSLGTLTGVQFSDPFPAGLQVAAVRRAASGGLCARGGTLFAAGLACIGRVPMVNSV